MKKLILSIFLFISILSPVCATGSNEYAKDFNTPLNLYFRDCSQGGDVCDTSVSAVRLTGTFEDGLTKSYFQTGTNVVLGSNYGVNVILSTDTTLLKNYLYSITFSTCNTGAQYDYNNEFWRISSGSSISDVASSSSKPEIISSRNDVLSDYPFSTNLSFSKCFMHTMNFVPKIDSNYLGLQIRSNTQNTTKLNFIGYKISELGNYNNLTADEVQTIITNNNQIIQNQIDDINSSISDTEDRLNQSIIDSNQATQDTINNNFNECHDSYNLYNYKDIYNSSSDFVVDNEGWITITYDNSLGTDTKYFNYWTNNLNLKTSTDYLIVTEIKNVTGLGAIQIVSKSGTSGQFITQHGYQFSSLTDNMVLFTEETVSSFSNVIGGLRTFVSFSAGRVGSITFRISVLEDTSITSSNFKYEPYGEQVCTNRIDETNDKLDNVNNSLNNSDTTDAENDAFNFFDNFTVEDNGGISSIITAPLRLVNSLLSGSSCENSLDFQILGADVSLPSGCILWNLAPDSVVIIYHTIICGFASYSLLRKLFKDIDKLKNPNNNEVSTIDL